MCMDMALHKPRDCTGCMQSVDWTTLLKWGVTVIPTLGVLVHFNSDRCALNTLIRSVITLFMSVKIPRACKTYLVKVYNELITL